MPMSMSLCLSQAFSCSVTTSVERQHLQYTSSLDFRLGSKQISLSNAHHGAFSCVSAALYKRLSVRAKAVESTPPTNRKSLVCNNCDGNGMVLCSQCKGSGVNAVDHFNGQFKAGSTCWLCRGKKEMLCGDCNGAGFLGGFMTTPDE